MLPKKHRLTRREDFSIIYSRGSYAAAYSSCIAIKYLPSSQEASRIGFPLGKNFSKKAAERNRARRVLRAATSAFLARLKPGHDIIVMLRPDCRDLGLQKITVELNKVFAKANLLI